MSVVTKYRLSRLESIAKQHVRETEQLLRKRERYGRKIIVVCQYAELIVGDSNPTLVVGFSVYDITNITYVKGKKVGKELLYGREESIAI